jgi:diguanylate cyclase (GGDEF)-like protein
MLSFQTVRQIVVFSAVIAFLLLVHAAILALGSLRSGADPGPLAVHLSFLLFSFNVPILAGWAAFRKKAAVPFAVGAVFIATLALVATHQKSFLLFYVLYAGLFLVLDWHDKQIQGQILANEVEVEHNEGEKNQLELKLRKVKDEVDASLGKYTTYYGLREVSERFATTLALEKIAALVIEETRHFVPKGETYLLYLAEIEGASLSLIASHAGREEEKIKAKKGDFFDLWVLKNRKPLRVSDTQKDIFFDAKQIPDLGHVRSLIIAPLVSEGRVIGMFRINSSVPDTFGIDDLRLLDFISDLASSAISNAILFQKTEDLAIRDSLTGLYVQHYFKERLKEEHRRALLTQAKLSVLMCDLDRFKSYNDTFGHGAGDLILAKAAEIFASEVRDEGIVARYGGEEFSLLLPRFSKEMALELAERLRKRIECEKIDIRREILRLTVSIGVSTMPDDTLEREELIRKADQNLYEAKRAGRNRVKA